MTHKSIPFHFALKSLIVYVAETGTRYGPRAETWPQNLHEVLQ